MPNVSYCVDLNEVHFNKYTPQPETRIVATFYVSDISNPTSLIGMNKEGYFTSLFSEMEVDGNVLGEVVGNYQFSSTGEHVVKYTLVDNTSIGENAFVDCFEMSSVVVPNTVQSIGRGAFGQCTSLASVSLPNSVTLIDEYAFVSCGNLTNIIIPDSVTEIRRQALSYMGLTSVTIPSSVTSLGAQVFAQSNALEYITFLAATPPTIDEYTFWYDNGCPIYVPAESVSAYQSASSWSTYASRIQAIQTT